MSLELGLEVLARRCPSRWSAGSRGQPGSLDEHFAALEAGRVGGWRLLDWLHLLRHKQRWDILHPDRADHTSELIWQAAVRDRALRGQVLGRLVEGMCGREGLAPSMVAACRRTRPLEQSEPLLQDLLAALMVVSQEPEQLIRLCMSHHRSPRALLARAGMPTDLPLLDNVEAAIPRVMGAHAAQPSTARPAAQWLLMSLREAPLRTRAQIAEGLLTELSAEQARALPDLCWWLREEFGPQAHNSRGELLTAGAQAALGQWL